MPRSSLLESRLMKLQRADLAVLGASVIWGINYSSVKLALTYVPPFVVGMARFMIASVAIVWMLKSIEGSIRVSWVDVRRIVFVGVVGFGVQQACFLYGVNFTNASIAALLTALTRAVMTVIASYLARERLTGVMIVGVMLACIGMVGVVLGQGFSVVMTTTSLLGIFLVFAAGMIGGAMPLLNKDLLKQYSSLRTTTWTVFFGMLFLFPLGATDVRAVAWVHLPLIVWGALLFTGLGATATTNLLWNYGVAHIGVVRMTIYGYLPAILGVLMATILLHEGLSWLQWIGAIVTIGGIALSQYKQRQYSTKQYTSA